MSKKGGLENVFNFVLILGNLIIGNNWHIQFRNIYCSCQNIAASFEWHHFTMIKCFSKYILQSATLILM